MTTSSSYSLQRTMIIYFLLIGFAALMVASEFVLETHSTTLKQELTDNFQRSANGDLPQEQVYEPLVRIRNKAMMMVGVILAVVAIVLTMFIKTITEPLQHMVEVSKAISAGDLSQAAGVEARNELSSCPLPSTTCPPTCRRSSCFLGRYAIRAGRVTANTMELMEKEFMTPQDWNAMKQQLVRLESELATLGQVIDFFKLYSVDDHP